MALSQRADTFSFSFELRAPQSVRSCTRAEKWALWRREAMNAGIGSFFRGGPTVMEEKRWYWLRARHV